MIIRNPLNYTGSKDRILPQLLENFDYTKDTFIDFFCGSGVVGANVKGRYDRIVLNDGCWQIVELLKTICTDMEFISKVDKMIADYNLGKENKEEFLKLRDIYNTEFCHEETFDPVMLYCLIMHAFNYFAIFNRSEGFSVPSGKGRSSFNANIRKKLEAFQAHIHKSNLEFYNFKVHQFIDIIKETYVGDEASGLMVYMDPPYSRSCSDSSVNRSYGLTWGETEDRLLFDFCDWLNEKGASFALSNVLENNGKDNTLLKDWAKKYNIIPIELDYNNCHFQRKNAGNTKEVLIKNF